MIVTLDVTKLSGWLNAAASSNMPSMVVTSDVTKLSGWLNAAAPSNMPSMVVTLDVSKLSSWSNAAAFLNMFAMFVTLDVSQLDMSALNWGVGIGPPIPGCQVGCQLNKSDMSVMAETSQPAMGPYVAVASDGAVLYSVTAFLSTSLSVMARIGGEGGGGEGGGEGG